VLYFGGKRIAAPLIWDRIGNVDSYVEPFIGSASILLARPHEPKLETVNDADGMVVNMLRALKHDPDSVAHHADRPVWESDKHAIHSWLVQRKDSLPAKLEGDIDYFDAKIAGYWIWGKATHIGSGFMSGEGPWKIVDGQLLNVGAKGDGISRQIPHLAGPGQGVNRQLPQIPPRGVNTADNVGAIKEWFRLLSDRFRRVRITCGDWTRILGPSITTGNGTCGVVLDPPYDGFEDWYREGVEKMSTAVRAWCLENADHHDMRIALCGYFEEHDQHIPQTWERVRWKAQGGYGLQRKDGENKNNERETIWFSPHCIKPELDLFTR
jgi:DNA adenine methylase